MAKHLEDHLTRSADMWEEWLIQALLVFSFFSALTAVYLFVMMYLVKRAEKNLEEVTTKND